MKHLLLTLLFSTSLSAFSQVQVTTLPGHGDNILQHPELRATMNAVCYHNTLTCRCSSGEVVTRDVVKPDTLRALILATMCRKCAAEAMRGYVVIEQGKRPVYLDCHKRALKGSQVGWGYELIDPNYIDK